MAIAQTIKADDKNSAINPLGNTELSDDLNSTPSSVDDVEDIQSSELNPSSTLEADEKRRKSLAQAPSEIHDLMEAINDLLERGEDIPDAMILEFESQMNTASEFDVESLMAKFTLAATFNGISALLETHRLKQKEHAFLQTADDISEMNIDMPDIPNASVEELMNNMQQVDYHDSENDYSGYSDTIPSIQEEASVMPSTPQFDPAIEAVKNAKLGEARPTPNNPPVEYIQNIQPADIDKPQVEVDKKAASTPKGNDTKSQPNNVIHAAKPSIFAPLLSSLTTPFKAMMNLSKGKSVEPNLDREAFTQRIFDNKVKDFIKACEEQNSRLTGIKKLTHTILNQESDNSSERDELNKRADIFTKQSSVIAKSYASLIQMAPKSAIKEVNEIANKYKEDIKKHKEDVSSMVKESKPSAVTKFLGDVWKSISKSVDTIMQSGPLEGNGAGSAPIQTL
jgi:hypothetical protein